MEEKPKHETFETEEDLSSESQDNFKTEEKPSELEDDFKIEKPSEIQDEPETEDNLEIKEPEENKEEELKKLETEGIVEKESFPLNKPEPTTEKMDIGFKKFIIISIIIIVILLILLIFIK